jgi:predicted ABC-type ATPase
MIAAHYIGDTVTVNVPAIAREAAAQGWPHPLTSLELRALGSATARVLIPLRPNRAASCEQTFSRGKPVRVSCATWKPNGYTVAVRYIGCQAIRAAMVDRGPCGIWEDGSARGYVVAILPPPVRYAP